MCQTTFFYPPPPCSFHNEGGAAAYEVYPVCEGKNLTCSNNILNRMGEFNEVHDIIDNTTKICLTNCEDQVRGAENS